MSKLNSVIIVEDDAPLRESLKNILLKRNYLVTEAHSVQSAKTEFEKQTYDLVLLDLNLPDGSGFDIIKNIANDYTNRIIIISGTGTVDAAVAVMKQGAFDFLTKPVDRDQLLATMQKALELNAQLDQFKALREAISDGSTFEKIIVKSQKMKQVVQKAIECAKTNSTILVFGETGTGKELIAHAVHNHSLRKKQPFIAVNCAAIPENLAEAEFFGYEKGAFTGAEKQYAGKFALAQNGTLFLDEIGELPAMIQSKLLRVLESGEIFPLKGTQAKTLDVRIVAATNQNLEALIKMGKFREDLFYRIEQIKIQIPPLRERQSDILPLAEHFLAISNITLNKHIERFDDDARELLLNYPWPGNVRELKNIVNESVILTSGSIIRAQHLPSKISSKIKVHEVNFIYTLKEMEKKQIMKVLEITNYNIQKSSRLLGITRPSLYAKMEKYQIKK